MSSQPAQVDPAVAAEGPQPSSAEPGGELPSLQLARVDELVRAERFTDAVDLLTEVNRTAGDPELEIRLVDLRYAAATASPAGPERTPWPPSYADPFPGLVGRTPEIDSRELDTEVLGGAVQHHGCLLVRGLLAQERVARLVDTIERVLSEVEALGPDTSGGASSWYRPLQAPPLKANQALRDMVAGQGGIWLGDSPTGTARVLAEMQATGVIDAIAEHFGERPFFSLQKSTLRRSLPINKLVAWHQDGSFLTPGVRTMNTWVALSRCGGEYPSPGLEVVPRRVEEVQPVDGALTPHSIAEDLVAELAAATPTVRPEFAPGDALIFDERLVHRTFLTPTMTESRYALECWFFAPSHHSPKYAPLLV